MHILLRLIFIICFFISCSGESSGSYHENIDKEQRVEEAPFQSIQSCEQEVKLNFNDLEEIFEQIDCSFSLEKKAVQMIKKNFSLPERIVCNLQEKENTRYLDRYNALKEKALFFNHLFLDKTTFVLNNKCQYSKEFQESYNNLIFMQSLEMEKSLTVKMENVIDEYYENYLMGQVKEIDTCLKEKASCSFESFDDVYKQREIINTLKQLLADESDLNKGLKEKYSENLTQVYDIFAREKESFLEGLQGLRKKILNRREDTEKELEKISGIKLKIFPRVTLSLDDKSQDYLYEELEAEVLFYRSLIDSEKNREELQRRGICEISSIREYAATDLARLSPFYINEKGCTKFVVYRDVNVGRDLQTYLIYHFDGYDLEFSFVDYFNIILEKSQIKYIHESGSRYDDLIPYALERRCYNSIIDLELKIGRDQLGNKVSKITCGSKKISYDSENKVIELNFTKSKKNNFQEILRLLQE